MVRIFPSTGFLDMQALDYGLSEDILMENAAATLEKIAVKALEKRITSLPIEFCSAKKLTVLIVCGSGNNGGDGYALARRIQGKTLSRGCVIEAVVYAAKPPKTEACLLQAERAKKVDVTICGDLSTLTPLLKTCVVLVDCLFGSGLNGKPDNQSQNLIRLMNDAKTENPACYYLACDIPSGLSSSGEAFVAVFNAETTVAMGALKLALFSDEAKDFTGKITVADLGLSRAIFEKTSDDVPRIFLLEKNDLRLPVRKKQNVHKGTFGHAVIFSGTKKGAAVLAARAAFILGAGLVSVIHTVPDCESYSVEFPPEIMQETCIPSTTAALCAGMGLGRQNPAADDFFSFAEKNPSIPCVIDADLQHHLKLPKLLEKRGNLVLTPHPKEFAALLENCGFGSFSVSEISARRFELVASFMRRYPRVTLLLKGANTLICANDTIFVNTFGANNLAKGGSGDMLAGFITALLAQKYEPSEAAANASLIHGLAAKKAGGTYSLRPEKLFAAAAQLESEFC